MKVGLVLSGGGGKGAYELGVWKALQELNIDIDIFSGTSIGAINAVLFAQNNINVAEQLWEEVTMEMLAPISRAMLIRKGIELTIGGKYIDFAKKHMQHRFEVGITHKDGATNIINKYLNLDLVRKGGKICYVTCSELPDLNAKYFKITDYTNEEAKEMVIASASLPLIYDCSEIQGCKYIDGGLADNTPIKPVYDEGCGVIIVVLLSKESKIDRSLYP
ncbi:MAG: patatin-like phospholipase family protein, partial [Clostridium sp.]